MRRVFYEGRPSSDEQLYWFQDNRTGCEKQTVYFERIRQLDSELISKEKKHLVSAMERLKQLRYPRRKPVVLNKNWIERGTKYQQKSRSEKFEDRAKHGKKLALSLNAKQMEICVDKKNDRANLRLKLESPYRSIQSLQNNAKIPSNEQHTIQLDHTVNNFSDNKPDSRKVPIHDVFFPSLPCIPNVGYKTNIETENKLRILELANGEFQKCRLSNVPSIGKKRRAGERRYYPKAENGNIEYISNKNDTLTAIFDEMPREKECSESLQEDSVKRQEIGNSETQTMNLKCDFECDVSNARQPPPTRKNSHKSTSDSQDNSSNSLCVAIESSNV